MLKRMFMRCQKHFYGCAKLTFHNVWRILSEIMWSANPNKWIHNHIRSSLMMQRIITFAIKPKTEKFVMTMQIRVNNMILPYHFYISRTPLEISFRAFVGYPAHQPVLILLVDVWNQLLCFGDLANKINQSIKQFS